MTLVTRRHTGDGRDSEAIYSPCLRYRYALTRTWDATGRRLLYVMLNPSTATEAANDPTIERCERRARALGYGAFRVANLFALRETDPALLRRAARPVGPANDAQIAEAANWSDAVLCAWGIHGAHRSRGQAVAAILNASGKPLLTLGLVEGRPPEAPALCLLRRRPCLLDLKGRHACRMTHSPRHRRRKDPAANRQGIAALHLHWSENIPGEARPCAGTGAAPLD